MLYFSRWATALVVGTIVVFFVILLPNFFSRETVDSWPNWMPKQQIVLGLDLQGGSYLLYEIEQEEYVQQRINALRDEVRGSFDDAPRILYQNMSREDVQPLQFRLTDPAQRADATARLDALLSPLSNSLFAGSIEEFQYTIADDGLVRMTYTADGLNERVRLLVQQSIEVIDRRLNAFGTVEPNIQRQGANRILVEAPGLDDPQRLMDLIGQTAQLNFHMVEGQLLPIEQALAAETGDLVAMPMQDDPTVGYLVERRALVAGEDLIDAQAGIDQTNGQAVVNFRLNTRGAVDFGNATAANVGRQFAIVLDNQIVSAPSINEPIPGGSGRISGSSVDPFDVEEANDLAIVLRAGALPARLTIVERRTIGAGLGADSIRAGGIAAAVATVGVAVFMFLMYGLFGIIANIALLVNVGLIFAILNLLGATLTLPGIAGIVLTVGTAVDSNVLIYERIREELRAGRSTIQAIDLGFQRAIATVIDANVTTLIAAIVLYNFGTGPIRGFAITHAIGIVTTMFTAVLVSRLMVATWVRWRRPKTINL